jgi:hypothetical protein
MLNTYDYTQYESFVSKLVTNPKSANVGYAEKGDANKLNLHRMKRLDKQIIVDPEFALYIRLLQRKWTWLVITEPWCVDSAQILPIIAKAAACNPNITLQIVLREENTEIMNQHLTNGTRSIPKLICTLSETGEEVGEWGPRPEALLNEIKTYRSEHEPFILKDFQLWLHKWYRNDKGKSVQKDLLDCVKSWM